MLFFLEVSHMTLKRKKRREEKRKEGSGKDFSASLHDCLHMDCIRLWFQTRNRDTTHNLLIHTHKFIIPQTIFHHLLLYQDNFSLPFHTPSRFLVIGMSLSHCDKIILQVCSPHTLVPNICKVTCAVQMHLPISCIEKQVFQSSSVSLYIIWKW